MHCIICLHAFSESVAILHFVVPQGDGRLGCDHGDKIRDEHSPYVRVEVEPFSCRFVRKPSKDIHFLENKRQLWGDEQWSKTDHLDLNNSRGATNSRCSVQPTVQCHLHSLYEVHCLDSASTSQ